MRADDTIPFLALRGTICLSLRLLVGVATVALPTFRHLLVAIPGLSVYA